MNQHIIIFNRFVDFYYIKQTLKATLNIARAQARAQALT